MSNFEEEQESQADDENGDIELPPGTLSKFTHSLTPEQMLLWRPVKRAWNKQVENLKKARAGSTRSDLYDAFNRAQGKITEEKIVKLIDNAVAKGDAQALRVMAQLGGMDLSDRPQAAAGEGAKVIIIRPHPLLLTEAQEANVQRQIEGY